MNTKRLFSIILALMICVTGIYTYAASSSIGMITDLQLHKNKIFVDDQSYTIGSSVKIKSPEDSDVVNIYQLKTNMPIDFNYKINSDGTKTILDIEVLDILAP